MRSSGLVVTIALSLGIGCNGTSPAGEGERPSSPRPAPSPASKAAQTPLTPAAANLGEPEPAVPATGEVAASAPGPTGSAGGAAARTDPAATSGADTEGGPAEASHHTVLILGSSLAKTAFGSMLEATLDAHAQVDCHRFAKSATGLSRPDFFDWMAAATREIDEHEPGAIVVVMGGNDGQDLRKVEGKARVEWGSEDWAAAYRERVDAFVALLASEDRRVLWLGIPRTNTIKLEGKLATIRRVHRASVEAHPRGIYIDPTPFIEDDDGALRRRIEVRGEARALRGDDGVHFTMAGSRYLADRVAPQILGVLGVQGPG